MMLPPWLDVLEDGLHYEEGCEGEEQWMQALECGVFADAWRQKCATAQFHLENSSMNAGL